VFEYKGFQIDVTDRGQFMAVVEGIELHKPSLEEIKAAIDAETKVNVKDQKLSLNVVGIIGPVSGYGREKGPRRVMRGILVGVNRSTRVLMVSETPKDHEWKIVLPYSEANERFCQEKLDADKEAARVARIAEVIQLKTSGYGRIAAAKYAEVLLELAKSYRASEQKAAEAYRVNGAG
jgi:hypothetical protein